ALLELLPAAEEADDLAVFGVRGLPVPRPGHKRGRAGRDDGMKPLAYRAIRFRHGGNSCENSALPFHFLRCGLVGGHASLLIHYNSWSDLRSQLCGRRYDCCLSPTTLPPASFTCAISR